jgi:hypothetical protein
MNWNIGSMEPGMSELKNYLKMVEGSKIKKKRIFTSFDSSNEATVL